MHRTGRCTCKPTWQAQVYDKRAGKTLKRTFPTITAAKRWRTDALTAVRGGDLSADRGPLLTEAFEAWAEQARAGHIRNRSGDPYKPAALRSYELNVRVRVAPALGHLRLREVTTRDVQTMVDGLVRDGASPSTIDTTLNPLRALYRRAVARGDATINPTRGIEKPAVRSRVRRIASPAEARAMLSVLEPVERPLWATAFYAGLRRGELVGLRWEDVDLASGVIRVRRGWDELEGEIEPKSRQGRRNVPIAGVLRDFLVEHKLRGGEGHVFGSIRHVRTRAEAAAKVWGLHGLPTMTLHDCRHTFASLMIAAGVNAKALSVFMGHANIKITLDLYGHLMPGSEEEAATLLDAYLVRDLDGSTVAQTVAHPEGIAA
jgi:integrase